MIKTVVIQDYTIQEGQVGSNATMLQIPGGTRLYVPRGDPRYAAWISWLQLQRNTGAPIYLAFDQANAEVSALYVGQRLVPMAMRSEPGERVDSVMFEKTPSFYHLPHDAPDYPAQHNLLEDAIKAKRALWVTAVPGRLTLLDLRPAD